MNTNLIATTANVTADPELRFTPSGKAVANVRLAVNSRVRNASGEWADGEPTFYDVTLWEGAAENAAESYHKGDRVLVIGALQTEAWEYEGTKRTKLVIADAELAASTRFATVEITRTKRERTLAD